MLLELSPVGSQNSFSGKARVLVENGLQKLYSYSTLVAVHDLQDNTMQINGWFSATTAKHINSFLLANGFQSMSKNELNKKPLLTK